MHKIRINTKVVLYPKDTEKWKQFTTLQSVYPFRYLLFCIPKILKNESNSQLKCTLENDATSCFVSQRYWKMKAIHNHCPKYLFWANVVLYPKDTEKWKQFTTNSTICVKQLWLFCIPKILKNESNSQPRRVYLWLDFCCFVSQRYWKMKAIHNIMNKVWINTKVVLYPKDTEKWKQFTTSVIKSS